MSLIFVEIVFIFFKVLRDYVYEDWLPWTVISNTANDLYYMVTAISYKRSDISVV